MLKSSAWQISTALVLLILAMLLMPWGLYPREWRVQYDQWFGARGYEAPDPTVAPERVPVDVEVCPPDFNGWRDAATIADVDVAASEVCEPDDPNAVAAFVKGTNNVSEHLLMSSRLAPDAVVKGRDLDGDGDPDEIHLKLEVMELNGASPDIPLPIAQFEIAPGVTPGLWVFAPKSIGMSTENFESNIAQPGLRLPSPVIRVEQGDRVRITLENSHYMPHTVHLHGVDHPFVDDGGEGNDGVPTTSEVPIMPGASRTYELQPRQPGTNYYHCHVQPQAHVMMGLQGLFIVEENRPNNWVQSFNVGAGQVRHRSVASKELYDREYDIHYQDLDADLNNRIQESNDPRVISRLVNREFDASQAQPEYATMNGRSFPYTFRDALIVTRPDERLKLRVLNGGSTGIALHTHGHKVKITHYDGVMQAEAAQIVRDVIWIATAQRVDLDVRTKNDGLHSYGEGIWLLHDHQPKGVVTDGTGPGGNVSAIVYESYLREDGWPKTLGVDLRSYFDPAYYQRKIPVWRSYDPDSRFEDIDPTTSDAVLLAVAAVLAGFALGLLGHGVFRMFVRRQPSDR